MKNPIGQAIVVDGQVTLGDAASQAPVAGWVITGTASTSNTIRRGQTHNAFGEVDSETDGRGYLTNSTYNTLGSLVLREDPTTDITGENGVTTRARPQTRFYYDRTGKAVGTRDANGYLTTQLWNDGVGEPKVAKVFFPDAGNTALSSYDVFGNLRVSQDGEGRQTRYSYDLKNQLTRLDRPTRGAGQYLQGQASYETYEYDSAGNRIATASVLGRARSYYDIEGRVTKVTSIEGRDTTYAYTYDNTIAGAGGAQVGGWKTTTTMIGSRVARDNKDVFNRMTWRQDCGGHVFSFGYNFAGWLTAQTSSLAGAPQQSLSCDYYANGYLKRQVDNIYHTQSDYTYDDNGNRVFEGYERNDSASAVYANSSVSYDELNRVKTVTDPKYQISYKYDAVGNRRNVYSYYNDGLDGNQQTQDFWYLYDSLNRFTVTMGQLSGGVITRGTTGKLVGYNRANERVSAEYADADYASNKKVDRERYVYTSDGYLQDMFLSSSTNGAAFVEQSQAASTRNTDLAGRVTNYVERNADNSIRTNLTRVYDRDNRQTSEVDYTQVYNNTYKTDTYGYQDPNGVDDGTLRKIVTSNVATSQTRTFNYQWWDSAKQTELKVQANGGPEGWTAGTSKLTYDLNGNLYRATDVAGKRTIQYITDGDGQILYRQELAARAGSPSDWDAVKLEAVAGDAERKRNYYYLNGHRIGDVNNENGTPSLTDYATALAQAKNVSNDERNKKFTPTAYANFDENYQPINEAYPGMSPSEYTVNTGDTLSSIAARIWGDRAMWYLIADANGLSGVETLSAGMRLVIPNKVANIHNKAGTFKVYDAGEAIGDVSPTLPPPPPPPNRDCGGLGTIIMIAIAVVVTVYTAGAAAELLSVAVPAGVTTTFGAGLAVLGGGAGFGIGALGAAAIGGAAGSIASQGFAMAAGMQDKFSWKAVGQSALGSAVTAGVGGAVNQVGGALSVLQGPGPWQSAGRAALSSGINQALHGDWNWQTVMASAVGAGVGAAALQGGTLGNALGSVGSRIAGGFVGGVAGQWAGRGARAQYGNVLASTLGNAVGESLVDAASRPGQTQPSMSASGGGASGSWGSAERIDYSLASGGPVRFGTGSVETVPTPEELRASFRKSEVEYRQATDEGADHVLYRADDKGPYGTALRATGGDKQVALAMLATWRDRGSYSVNANGVPQLQDGQELPWMGTSTMSAEQLTAYARSGGQMLGAESATRAALTSSWSRFAWDSVPAGNGGGVCVRPQYGSQEWLASASPEELKAYATQQASIANAPGMTAYDPVAARAARVQKESLLNYLNGQGNMALGGLVATGVMLSTNSVVAASETTDAVAPLDSLMVPGGGTAATTRLASGTRVRTQMPLGFAGRTEYLAFGDALYAGLERAGFKDVQAGFQGSSVTGRAFRPPQAPFDVGRVSDYDIALSGPELFQRAQDVGIGLRQQGTRTGPLMPEHLERLGLTDLSNQLSLQAGRPVNFMIYQSVTDAVGRSPTILVPREPR